MKKIIMIALILVVSALHCITLKDFVLSSGFQNSTSSIVSQQGTIGQVTTEVMSNSSFTLHSGYWQPITRPSESGIEGILSLITYNPPGGIISNVNISANGITVHPDMLGHYQISLAPGTYTLTASLPGYNTIEISGIAVLSSAYTTRNLTLVDWVSISGTQYSMLLMATVLKGTTTYPGTNGNILAAFGPGGNQDCRGIGFWIPELGIYYLDIVGNANGQAITFKFLDQALGQIVVCNESVTFTDNTMIGAFDTPFVLHLPLGTITNVSIQKNANNIVLNWDGPDGVNYHIYRSNNPYSGFADIGTAQVRTYTDINVLASSRVFYKITYDQ